MAAAPAPIRCRPVRSGQGHSLRSKRQSNGRLAVAWLAQHIAAAPHRLNVVLATHYLVRDRDRVYGAAVKRRLRAMGIRDKPIVPASPWQNGFAERLIGSIRRKCLDHIIVLGEAHLRWILKSYVDYYNGVRTN